MIDITANQQALQEDSDSSIYVSAIPASFDLGAGAWMRFIFRSVYATIATSIPFAILAGFVAAVDLYLTFVPDLLIGLAATTIGTLGSGAIMLAIERAALSVILSDDLWISDNSEREFDHMAGRGWIAFLNNLPVVNFFFTLAGWRYAAMSFHSFQGVDEALKYTGRIRVGRFWVNAGLFVYVAVLALLPVAWLGLPEELAIQIALMFDNHRLASFGALATYWILVATHAMLVGGIVSTRIMRREMRRAYSTGWRPPS